MIWVDDLGGGFRHKIGSLSAPSSASPPVKEVPQGVVDGVNATFTLAGVPNLLILYKNGLLMSEGADNDYTISGNTITFTQPPASGSLLVAVCWY